MFCGCIASHNQNIKETDMQQLDLLIRNGCVVDGTGTPAYSADIGVRNGRIAAIGHDLGSAAQTIDARLCRCAYAL